MTRRSTTKEFIEKAREKYGNKYDYSLVEYKNSRAKVIIICPRHKPFEQTPASHLGGNGCPICGVKIKTLTKEEFIRRSNQKHGNKYNYSNVVYKNSYTKVVIGCPEHGTFEQLPKNHANRGDGCFMCSVRDMTCDKEEFVEKVRKVHGNRYNYSLVEYKNSPTKITIICFEHGAFEQRASAHLGGHGCPGCASGGFDPVKPAILYYVRIETENGPFYKIGITNRTVKERFHQESINYTTLKEWEYPIGADAREIEKKILSIYKDQLYEGDSVLGITKASEIFDMDILGLDRRLELVVAA